MDDGRHAREVATLAPYLSEERRARIEAVLAARLRGLTVLVEDVHDPHNAAAVLRTCEALGIADVHVVEAGARFAPSDKVTQGADRWLDLWRHPSVEAAIERLRVGGYRLFGAAPEARAALADVPVAASLALVFGNEHEGLSPYARERMDGSFRIPMHGMTRSFNVSVAVAVAAFDVARRLRARMGRDGDLDEPTRVALRARWYRHSVRGAAAILRRAGA